MKPRITVITVGVDDLERSLRFYRDGLGLTTEGIIGQETVASSRMRQNNSLRRLSVQSIPEIR